LLIGDLAQVVLRLVLEVQRRHVIEHQSAGAGGPCGVRPAGRGQLAAVVAAACAGQGGVQGVHVRGTHAQVVQDAHGVGLADRLDHPCQHELHERLVVQDGEPEPLVGIDQHVPQDLAGAGHDPRPRPHGRRRRVQAEVQLVLPGVQPLPGDLHQHRELGLIVRRAKVLDDPAHPGTLVHDLHGRRPRRGLHLPHERGHIVRIPGTLSAPDQPPTRP